VGLAWALLLFPDGRLPSRRWRAVGIAAGVVTALLVAVELCVPFDLALAAYGQTAPPEFAGLGLDPLALPLPAPLWLRLAGAVPWLLLALGACAVVTYAARFRAADLRRRAQLRWVLVALALATLWLGAGAFLPFALFNVGIVVVALAVAAALVVAVTQHRLYDIDAVLVNAVVLGALTALVVVVDVAVFAAGGALGARNSPAAYVVATVVVAAAYAPLRARLQRRVSRALQGSRSDRYALVSTLARRLEETTEPDAMLLEVAVLVSRAFRAPYVRMELDRPDGTTTVAEHGRPQEPVLVLPLKHRDEAIGRLVLAPPSTRLSDADQALLADVVRQAGVAARALVLSEALQESRERLVTAREEERRRLRRDLHDGLGPALGALTLKVETARALLHDPDPRADGLLVGVTQDVNGVLADVRRLVHGLRPPALDEVGLAGALEQQAEQFRREAGAGGPLSVTLRTEGDLRQLPAAVEVAAYRIVSEALANVARHAAASSCTIDVVLNGSLLIEVRDDGVGVPAAARLGVGLTSMAERARELGGTAEVLSGDAGSDRVDGGEVRGTVVRAVLPLPGRAP
jgi:signal transduction histidine kinase